MLDVDLGCRLRVDREQAVWFRLQVNNLTQRLPTDSHETAAVVGLQDTAPRDALVGLHARMTACRTDAWCHASLVQTYSPREAVYVLPLADLGVFTLGRLPLDPARLRQVDRLAERVCDELSGRELRGGRPGLRAACASGRLALRWTTSSLWVREVPRPAMDVHAARRELCVRHLHHFGPTNLRAYAWWAGMSTADASQVWRSVATDIVEVDLDGTPAWVLRADEPALRSTRRPDGVRLLAEPDLRLFGRESTGRFVAPGRRRLSAAADSHHPNGVLADGRIVGAWGRRRGRVDVVLTEPLERRAREALDAEVSSLPIPGVQVSADVHSRSVEGGLSAPIRQ